MIPLPFVRNGNLWVPASLNPRDMVQKMGGSSAKTLDELVSVEPTSIDIKPVRFYDANGRDMGNFPIQMDPGKIVSIHTGLMMYDDNWRNIYGLDSKSRKARRGLCCLGFKENLDERVVAEQIKMFARGDFPLNFVLENKNSIPIFVEEPADLVQLTGARYVKGPSQNLPFRISRGGKDVTEECKVDLGNGLIAYKVRVLPQVYVPKHDSPPIRIMGGDQGEHVRIYYDEIDMGDILEHNPDFCLTLTEEAIHTNGCPAYMFPFHFLDAFGRNGDLSTTRKISDLVKSMYMAGVGMPVTANAGILNPTDVNRIVCENVTADRDLAKYFAPGEPFALVIPVPYLDNHLYVAGDPRELESVARVTL